MVSLLPETLCEAWLESEMATMALYIDLNCVAYLDRYDINRQDYRASSGATGTG